MKNRFVFYIRIPQQCKRVTCTFLSNLTVAQTELTIAVSRSPKYTGLGHFTLLFRRREQRCTKTENARAKPMVHLLVLLFGDVLFDVTVVVS